MRIVSICAIFILAINIVGYYPLFKADQWLVRREIKRRIKESVPADELHQFQFLKSDVPHLDWVKPKKEFRLDGHMYDVVTKVEKGDSTYFSCINDVKETQLFAHLDELTKKQSESGNTPLSSFRKMAQVYLSAKLLEPIPSETIFLHKLKLNIPDYSQHYNYLKSSGIDHPPQQFS